MVESADQSNAFGDSPRQDEDTRRCPGCGTSTADLYIDGRMGCARCYETFTDVIQRALVVLHGSNAHTGKAL